MTYRKGMNALDRVTPKTMAARVQDWKMCERCGATFFRKGYEVPWLWKKHRFCSRVCGRPVKEPFDVEKFNSHIVPGENGCEIWAGKKDDKGYGTYWANGKHQKAHRVAWEAFIGPIPAGMHVLHKCDNPPCIRLDHLWLGTHRDNMDDMTRKGRARGLPGSSHNMAILNETQVLEIFRSSETRPVLAVRYGVSRSTISAIRTGQNWSHVTHVAAPS